MIRRDSNGRGAQWRWHTFAHAALQTSKHMDHLVLAHGAGRVKIDWLVIVLHPRDRCARLSLDTVRQVGVRVENAIDRQSSTKYVQIHRREPPNNSTLKLGGGGVNTFILTKY